MINVEAGLMVHLLPGLAGGLLGLLLYLLLTLRFIRPADSPSPQTQSASESQDRTD